MNLTDNQPTTEAQLRYSAYLVSDYWKQVSDAVKAKAGYRCQVCNSPHDLQAHHRSYAHRGRELEHIDDLTCLCRRCHETFHGKAKDAPKPPRAVEVKNQRPPAAKPVEPQMPPGESIALTSELIDACRTNGAFTSATVRALGLKPGHETKGWTFRLVGVVLTREQYRKALEGRFVYAKKKHGRPAAQ